MGIRDWFKKKQVAAGNKNPATTQPQQVQQTEQMCREYLLRYAENLPILLSDVGQWWGTDSIAKKEVQIDIVGTPVEGEEYIIGSCKFRNEPVGADELKLIRRYADVFGKGKKYHCYIFSKSGFTTELKLLEEQGEVNLVTLEEMYR